MIWDVVKTNVLLPMVGRIGTASATVLVGYGINASHAEQVGVGVTAAGLIIFDLCLSWYGRKAAK